MIAFIYSIHLLGKAVDGFLSRKFGWQSLAWQVMEELALLLMESEPWSDGVMVWEWCQKTLHH